MRSSTTLMTSDGVPIDFHAVLSYRITDSVKLVRDFGADFNDAGIPGFWIRNLEQPFRTAVRDAVKKRGMNEMAIVATAAEAVDKEITQHLLQIVKETGVPILIMDVTLGRANPPDAIKSQRVATAEQEQRVNTERQRKLAEDQRKDAESARAAADNAYRQSMQLSPEQFLQLEAIKMQREVCGRQGACTFLLGAGCNARVERQVGGRMIDRHVREDSARRRRYRCALERLRVQRSPPAKRATKRCRSTWTIRRRCASTSAWAPGSCA